MIAFPLLASLIALACAAFVGWDAWQRPRPERIAWTIAFLVFALAAGAEVAGSAIGWNATLARIYYLTGAVLVVGILAVGELYLLLPGRVPAIVPGIVLLVTAVAVTAVWSAPIDAAKLSTQGWEAIARGPFLVALAASINAVGTLTLAGGALYSAWRMRGAGSSRDRAIGCILIAIGTVLVAAGGTLTRFGHHEYLYLAMAGGVAVIFLGVLMTRGRRGFRRGGAAAPSLGNAEAPTVGARLVALPKRPAGSEERAGIDFVVARVLSLGDAQVIELCRQWSATTPVGDALSREQARHVWSLRLALPGDARARLDAMPLSTQSQIAELYREVWSRRATEAGNARHG